MRVADNMRNVAVTEGDKVEAQIKFGWEVDAYPVNEVADAVAQVGQGDVNALVEEYYDKYQILLEGRDEAEFRKHVAVQDSLKRTIIRQLLHTSEILDHFSNFRDLQCRD